MLSVGATLVAASLSVAAQDETAPETPAAASDAPAAAPEAASPAPDAPDAAALLGQSREKLAGYRTLKATMSQTIDFGPTRRFKAEGTYLQGTGNKVRLALDIEVGKNKGELLQVSEGDVLWTVYKAGPTPKITRRDVKQILEATTGAEAKSTWLAELGLGGLPALLASIEGSIDFQPPMQTVIEGRKFYVLEGAWKPALRAQFEAQVPQSASQPDGPKVLPAHVPELVRVYLDAETLFPYRIRYLKQSTAAGQEPRPLLTIDFRDIVANAPIEAEAFQYVPPKDATVADITKAYLDQLKGRAGQAPPATPPAN